MPIKNYRERKHLTSRKKNELFYDGAIMIIIMNTIKSFSIGLIIMYTVIWLIMAITVKNSLLLAYTIFTIIFSMFAILGICKGKYTILHVYEVIILLSYVLVGIAGLSLLGMALKDDCSSTFTYF